MTGPELLELLHKAKRRSHVIGSPENGIVIKEGGIEKLSSRFMKRIEG